MIAAGWPLMAATYGSCTYGKTVFGHCIAPPAPPNTLLPDTGAEWLFIGFVCLALGLAWFAWLWHRRCLKAKTEAENIRQAGIPPETL